MKILFLLTGLTLLISGCATSRDVRQADGWVTHVISCGGPLLNIGHCQEKAGDICRGRGYTVLNALGGELPTSPNAIPIGGGPDLPKSLEAMKDYPQRKLFIRCN